MDGDSTLGRKRRQRPQVWERGPPARTPYNLKNPTDTTSEPPMNPPSRVRTVEPPLNEHMKSPRISWALGLMACAALCVSILGCNHHSSRKVVSGGSGSAGAVAGDFQSIADYLNNATVM